MGLFNFFRPKTQYEKLLSMVGPMIVKAYRKIAKERGIAPSSNISDKKIIEIYVEVEAAFKKASQKRNEEIRQEHINTIVLHYYQFYESFEGDDMRKMMFYTHLENEVQKYIKEGLPKKYRQDLVIFGE